MLPLITALSGNSPISANAVTDLPQPDSPIRPERPAAGERKADAAHRIGRAAAGIEPDAQILDFDQRRLVVITAPAPAADRTDPQAIAQQIEPKHRVAIDRPG
jgi:hypothetical protein